MLIAILLGLWVVARAGRHPVWRTHRPRAGSRADREVGVSDDGQGAAATHAAKGEGEATGAVAALVDALLYGGGRGLPALLKLESGIAGGRLSRSTAALAALDSLTHDIEQAHPALANPEAAARFLLGDLDPAAEVRAAAAAYGEFDPEEPGRDAHARLHVLLGTWPALDLSHVRGIVADFAKRTNEFETGDGAQEQEMLAALARLLRSERVEDRVAVLAIFTDWIRDATTAGAILRSAIELMLRQAGPRSAVVDLLVISSTVQEESGLEIAHAGPLNAGMDVALLASGLVGTDRDWSARDRAEILSALLEIPVELHSPGAEFFLSVALGGAPDGHQAAIAALGTICRGSKDPVARQTALVNLGRLCDLQTLLAESGASVRARPTDEADYLQQVDLFGAIHNVLNRHPEDWPEALRMYQAALDSWSRIEDPTARLVVSSLLSDLADSARVGSPEALDYLRSLSRQESETGRLAREVVAKLDRRK